MSDAVLVVGNGGREHVLASCLALSPKIGKVYVAPGNPGTTKGKLVNTSSITASNPDGIAIWCQENSVSLTVIGPEAPLAAGIADTLGKANVKCFGPSAAAAQIEASKAWSKSFMTRHNIPTARWESFTDVESACRHIDTADYECLVVKASGLAAGKGVIVAEDKEQAKDAVRSILQESKFGSAGEIVVLEERLVGEEFSVLSFCDGRHAVCMPPAQDHKALREGNTGPNTGGMGAYAPCPQVTTSVMDVIKRDIVQKAVDGMREEGCPYVGALYTGLMLTKDGPKVLEFNCRFGDPEAQVILPLLKSDLYDTLLACVDGKLPEAEPEWHEGRHAAAVVLASEGYPGSYPKGRCITGIDEAEAIDGVRVYQAGTSVTDGKLVTSGGRVLAVSASSAISLDAAIKLAYDGVSHVTFDGAYHRKDIGRSATQA
ncbi:trifunctional purine biosynthetic protein adenosine-3-like isoform X1 [Sycon ciliatum]|uniref:trifunctional purine biosynthetic protein adenosine-3-like isoform X1 n=1 Tax=Sycon ciliatum TaxID=27933 RepID=UPI0031F6E511